MKLIAAAIFISFCGLSLAADLPPTPTPGVTIPLPGGATLWVLPLDGDGDTLVVTPSYSIGDSEYYPPPIVLPATQSE